MLPMKTSTFVDNVDFWELKINDQIDFRQRNIFNLFLMQDWKFLTRKTEKLKCQNFIFVREGGLQTTEVEIKKNDWTSVWGWKSAFYFSILSILG